MQKFDLNFSQLSDIIVEKPIERIPVRGNENRMVRVAFDLFRLDGNNREHLWQVQADDDGNEFLVRTYNLPEEEEENFQKSSDWDVLLDKKGSNFTVAFKGVPIKRLVASDYNVNNKEDAILFREVVLKKIATDENFQNLLLGQPLNKNEQCPCDCHGGDFGLGEPGLLPQMDGVILFVDENKKEDNEKEDSPSEDYTDANNWWENLSDKDKEELFDKFKDAPSITKEQAFKIVNLELKLAKK